MALATGSLAAAAGFGALTVAVAHRETARVDDRLRQTLRAPERHPARKAASATAPIGKWYTYLPAALAVAAVALAAHGRWESPRTWRPRRRQGRRRAAAAILATGAVATALNPLFDHLLPQPPAPPGHRDRSKPVFPSGHAFGPGAIALASAYLLAREGIVRGALALPVALAVPLLTAGGRVLEEKHWASDVLGGYLGAAAVAGATLVAYEVGTRP